MLDEKESNLRLGEESLGFIVAGELFAFLLNDVLDGGNIALCSIAKLRISQTVDSI